MSKKPNRKRNMSEDQRLAVTREWGGIEVIDAVKELRVMVLPEDVEGATPKDPGCCVFARACKRCFQSTKVMFFRTRAYVELPDADGKLRVERFMLSREMRRLIADFDTGKGVVPKGGFILSPPPPSRSLNGRPPKSAAEMIHNAEICRRSRERKKILGTASDPLASAWSVDGLVRSGEGAVHFTRTKDKAK